MSRPVTKPVSIGCAETGKHTLGYWRDPPLTGSKLSWQAPVKTGLQVWIGLLDDKPIAHISRQPGHGKGCSATLSGWVWTEHLAGSGAEQLGVKESPTRGFLSVPAAKKAIKEAIDSKASK